MTITEFADEHGINRRSYENWEQGRPVSMANLRLLADIYDLPPDDLADPHTSNPEEIYRGLAKSHLDLAADSLAQAEESLSGITEEEIERDEELAARVNALEQALEEHRGVLQQLVALLGHEALSGKDEALDRLAGQLGPTSLHPLEELDGEQGQ